MLDGQNLTHQKTIARSLIVEGWRFIAHSYAMVNQWQLLALLRRPDIAVKVIDLPFYRKRWQPQDGLFNSPDEQALRSIGIAGPKEGAEVTLRISIPFDFSPSRSERTVVFGTSETQVLREEQFLDPKTFALLLRAGPPSDIRVVTPSRWSAEAYYKAGFTDDRVLIVPHGADIGVFYPMRGIRDKARKRLALSADEFVFLSIGSMTGNKGIDLLLQAFSEVCRKFPYARLVLKGLDTLYQSDVFLSKNMQTMSAKDQERVRGRITYLGGSFSNEHMAKLYQIADAYVSPYRAEGFNMPVLEAAACGIPIICTRGGATDDFTTDAFARRIDSQKTHVQFKGQEISRLEPDLEHLTYLMTLMIEDRDWRERAVEEGPRHVRAGYTWDQVTDLLVGKLFN
jgi:glycosyltransferase involved in cell wall biosynthesis